MLRDVLSSERSDPPRVINLAAPVRRTDGEVSGVIASHLSWAWLADLVRHAAPGAGVAVALMSRAGTVLIGPAGTKGKKLATQRAFTAQHGASATFVKRWPAGRAIA